MITRLLVLGVICLPSVTLVASQTNQKPATAAPLTSPVPVTGRGSFTCSDSAEPIRATFYKTQPGLAVLQRGSETRVAFAVVSASGAHYVGDEVSFWEAKGEATINWSGKEQRCRKNP